MALKIIYGRAGVGKSLYCINEMKESLEKGSENKKILIVPEQFTFETENKMLGMIGESCVLSAEVLSFKRLANRVFNNDGGVTKRSIKDAAKSMLIHKVLDDVIGDMKVFGVAAKKEGFIDIISTLVTEFKKYNVDEEVLLTMINDISDPELVNKLSDLEKIFRGFNKRLHKAYIDGEDELALLVKKLKDSEYCKGADIWIDEFTTFTPQQMDIIIELMKKAKSVNITLSMSDGSESYDLKESDIYSVTKKTEKRLLKAIEENNIGFKGYHNIKTEVPYRFKNNPELAHMEKQIYSYPFKTYNNEVENLRLYRANNSYDEIEFISKDILRLVREENYRFRDISVICRNVDAYGKVASVILEDYEIPYYIDKKIDVASNPLVILVTSAFDIINRNWSYESVFKYLKSGLTGIDRENIDILENYVLAYGIKGDKWKIENWEYASINSFKAEELTEEKITYLNTINDIKSYVEEPLRELEEKCRKKGTLKEYAVALYEFLNDTGVLQRVKDKVEEFEKKEMPSKVKEYSQILDILMEVLEQSVDVLGDEKVDKKEFIKILNVGFSKYEMGVVPVALDQVNIGDITRIKSRGARAIYIVGANDGVLPSAGAEEGILSDRDRNMLKELGMELAADTRTQAFEEQFMVYTALTIARDYMVISYPLADFEGKAMRPSVITHRIKKIFPKLKEESSGYNLSRNRDEFYDVSSKSPTFNELISAIRRDFEHKEPGSHWDEVYKYYNDDEKWNVKLDNVVKGLKYSNIENSISKEMAKNLYSSDNGKLMFSVSKLERYAQCPFAYFIEYGLKAKDRKLYEFSAPDLGSFMHEVLDDFTNDIKSKGKRWSDLGKKECRGMVNDLVNDKINNNEISILNSSNRFKYLTERYKKILTRSVMTIAEQMRRSEFEIFSNEFGFGYGDDEPIEVDLPTGEKVYLIGKVDRVDTLDLDGNSYIRIIDYKTGKKKFDMNKLYNGLQIQLLVYLDVLLKNSERIIQKQAMPGAMFYFRLDDPMITSKKELSEEEIEIEILKKLKFDGLMLKDPKIALSMDNELEEGKSSMIIPANFIKGGKLGNKDSLITEKQFDILRNYVNDKVIELCTDMISGNIALEPYDTDKEYLYENSPYAHIFQFDTTVPGNKYRKLEKDKPKEVWEKIAMNVGEELEK